MSTPERLPNADPRAAADLDLERLDAFRPATLDPACRAVNLAALDDLDHELATAIAATALPAHWRAAQALDGAVTFRVEPAGQPAAWLAGTAAPDTRARGLLEAYDPLGKNPVLPCAGAGGEIRFLLARLPRHLALFVLEPDLAQLAAVLQLVEAAAAIRERRLILVPPGREARFLSSLLEREPGLLPPGTILAPSLVDRERLAAVQRLCERIYAETAVARQRGLLAVQQREAARTIRPAAPPRLALVAMTLDRVTLAHVGRIRAAAEALGCPATDAALRDPGDAHPLAHAERLAHFGPTMTIWVGHDPAVLPVTFAGQHAVWVPGLAGATPASGPAARYLAASPRVAQALLEAGAAPDAVTPWYWAASESRLETPPCRPTAASRRVIIVGDLPATDAATLGLTLESQRLLWEQIRSVVRANWEHELVRSPARILETAERTLGYTIRDATLREQFVRLIAAVAVPAETLAAVVAALRAAGYAVAAIGGGWHTAVEHAVSLSASDATALADDAFADPGELPRGFVFAGATDPLTAALVELAAFGLPIALHAPGGDDLAGALGDVLDPDRDLHPFATRQQLLAGVESFVSPAGLRRAEQARARLRASHTWKHRVRELLARSGPGE